MERHTMFKEDSAVTETRRRMPSNSPENSEMNTSVPSESVLDKAFDTFCKVNTVNLVQFLSFAVTIGSLVYEFRPPPPAEGGSYFSDKRNFFNQYFVKLAWGWTMAIYTPFVVLSGLQSPAKIGQIFRGLVRVLAVGTAAWYWWVEIVFHRVMQVTGACVGNESLTAVRACIKAGHYWDGYDISGHCFLLIYSALLIHEELRIVRKRVITMNKRGRISNELLQNNATIPAANVTVSYDSLVSFLQKLFTVLLIMLELLWILMVMMTSIYFHVWSHKLLGTLIAIVSWHCTYNLWYKAMVFPG
ncbi:fat storage-inducing transmembrane protein 2-like [Patiria miniata]|uniref:Fat storage-inducing transmembrane protein n=1 Tax=Patiria miniata TaxID=46514 RepID=A0A914BS70_PATMI|nr:fat storage-inducing transmembrane protein 2-like [Patiria miniata]